MTPDPGSSGGTPPWCALGLALVLTACTTMSEQERKTFLCEEWDKGTKNVDQLKATYSIATGQELILRSGGPRTGITLIEGDLRQLAQEVDKACDLDQSQAEQQHRSATDLE